MTERSFRPWKVAIRLLCRECRRSTCSSCAFEPWSAGRQAIERFLARKQAVAQVRRMAATR